MAITARNIAALLLVDVKTTAGSMDCAIKMVCSVFAPQPYSLVYLKQGASLEYQRIAAATPITIICADNHFARLRAIDGVTLICVDNPRLSFIRAAAHFFTPQRPLSGVHPTAIVEADAHIDSTASVGAGVYIGRGCTVGARCVLHANVTLYAAVEIGADVIINAGTVIGADGFGYERDQNGRLEKFQHHGGVVIEDGVEIGSNTSIDRGTLSPTVIKQGAKIDNQVHISHNVEIGRHAAVIAQSMVGGSAKVGDYAWLAPASIIMNQVRIGERATVGMGAVVVKDVPAGQTVFGSPAVEASEFRAMRNAIKKLTR